MTPIAFITAIRPGADCCEIDKGIPSGFSVAQAALESGWGTSGLSVKAKNLFGVKADKAWLGPTITMMTSEHINGEWVRVPARWRAYETWEECILDHGEFFHVNPRYSKALEYPHDAVRFAEEVAAAGYATDPEYAEKLIRIIQSHKL